jgi:hypothetical protein
VASTLIAVVIVSAVAIVAIAALAADGFHRGHFSGESLARALRKDLEAAAAESDRTPPH